MSKRDAYIVLTVKVTCLSRHSSTWPKSARNLTDLFWYFSLYASVNVFCFGKISEWITCVFWGLQRVSGQQAYGMT